MFCDFPCQMIFHALKETYETEKTEALSLHMRYPICCVKGSSNNCSCTKFTNCRPTELLYSATKIVSHTIKQLLSQNHKILALCNVEIYRRYHDVAYCIADVSLTRLNLSASC